MIEHRFAASYSQALEAPTSRYEILILLHRSVQRIGT